MADLEFVEKEEPTLLNQREEDDPEHSIYPEPEEEPVDEAVAEEPPPQPPQPQFTPRETQLYAQKSRWQRRAEESQARYAALEERMERLQESAERWNQHLDDEEKARRAAAAVPDDDDPFGKLAYQVEQRLSEQLGGVSEIKEAFKELRTEREQRAAEEQRVYQTNLRTAAVGEMRQQISAAPEPVRESMAGWVQKNAAALAAEGYDQGQIAQVIEEELLNYTVQATRQGQTIGQFWGHVFDIQDSPAAEQSAPPEPTPPTDVRQHQKARAQAPRQIPRGRAPAADSSDPIQQLAARQRDLSGEELYAKIEAIAEARKMTVEQVEERLIAETRKIAAAA